MPSFVPVLVIVAAVCACQGDRPPPRASGSAVPSSGGPAPPPATEREAPAPELGSAAAAAAVVRDYYAAVAAGDFRRAHGLWSGDGAASGQTLEEMRAGYAQTAAVRAEVGTPGRVEPAAGSRYVRVPVTVRATTRSGEAQCFAGSYVLRRSSVPGATADQRSWRIHSADLTPCPGPGAVAGAAAGDELPPAAARVVATFGERLASVSTGPAAAAREAIRERYGPLVTPELLTRWEAAPAQAPGRAVSSPWPARIEVRRVRRLGPRRIQVGGQVVYVSSTELAAEAAGEALAAADRRPVQLEIVRTEAGAWRIADYADACSGAAVAGDLPEQVALPAAVATTRAAIFEAAVTCDYEDLDRLAPPELRYTFGDHRDAVASWRTSESRGEPVLRRMAEVLRLTPAHEHALWTWPAFFTRTVEEWSPTDRREAERLLGPEELREVLAMEAYLGYRLGIADDGTWQYFVAGD